MRARAVYYLSLILAVSFLSTGCGRPGGESPDVEGKVLSLTFLHTSDIHSRIISYQFTPLRSDINLGLDPKKAPFGGIARIMTVLRQERAKSERVLHLDSGDIFQGAPIFNVFRGEPELRALSIVGLDAFVIGNHEFDNGGFILSNQLALWSSFPVLAANYIYLQDSRRITAELLRKLSHPFVILNAGGVRVGVIGLANTSSLTSLAEGGNSLGITAMEPNQTLRRYARLLRPRVDLLVPLTHLGLTEDQHMITGYYRHLEAKFLQKCESDSDCQGGESCVFRRCRKSCKSDKDCENGLLCMGNLCGGHEEEVYARKWIEGVGGIDLILGGHHHVVLNPPKILIDRDKREVLLVHSGAFAKYVGRLDLVVKVEKYKGYRRVKILSYRYKAIPITGDIPEDPEMLRMLEPYIFEINRTIDTSRTFAFAPQLVPRFGRGSGDSALGNLVADAMKIRQRVEADFALTNSLGIRADLQAGPVTIERLYEIFPFENSITTLFLSGREVQELLDFVTARSSGRGCQSQAQVSGISFIMNCRKRRAEAICVGSQPNPPCSKTGGKTPCFDPTAKEGPKSCPYGAPLNELTIYKLAANDYIANGGSGFKVLQRNTTQYNTGVSLRDALIEYIESLPTCEEVDRERKKQGLPPLIEIIPQQYRDRYNSFYKKLPCVIGREAGRIRKSLQ